MKKSISKAVFIFMLTSFFSQTVSAERVVQISVPNLIVQQVAQVDEDASSQAVFVRKKRSRRVEVAQKVDSIIKD